MSSVTLRRRTPINSLAQRLGVTHRTLRLYEDHGLVSAERDARNVRVYDAEQVARATLIVALRQLGVGLAEIGRFFCLSETDADRVMRDRLDALRRRKAMELAYLDLVLDDLAKGLSLTLSLDAFLKIKTTQDLAPMQAAH